VNGVNTVTVCPLSVSAWSTARRKFQWLLPAIDSTANIRAPSVAGVTHRTATVATAIIVQTAGIVSWAIVVIVVVVVGSTAAVLTGFSPATSVLYAKTSHARAIVYGLATSTSRGFRRFSFVFCNFDDDYFILSSYLSITRGLPYSYFAVI